MRKLKTIVVTKEFENQRIDGFLSKKLALSLKSTRKNIHSHQIKLFSSKEVNLKDDKDDFKIFENSRSLKFVKGDLTRAGTYFLFIEEKRALFVLNAPLILSKEAFLRVHDDYLIVYKPPHMHCHPKIFGDGKSLIEQVAQSFSEVIGFTGSQKNEGGLCHRLDFETQGVLVIARNQAFHLKSRKLFAAGSVTKTYRAMVPKGITKREISSFLGPKNNKKTAYSSEARKGFRFCQSKILKVWSKGSFDMIEISMNTGMRHQIRCLLASISYPLIGDKLYGSKHTLEIKFPSFYLKAHSIQGFGGDRYICESK